ncbi:MAG: hypothetical protein M1824_003174 [Vezdaea acicularis]|nr:MAG: hypothetical protein M1824_003174 [Vezdaea acicularis]
MAFFKELPLGPSAGWDLGPFLEKNIELQKRTAVLPSSSPNFHPQRYLARCSIDCCETRLEPRYPVSSFTLSSPRDSSDGSSVSAALPENLPPKDESLIFSPSEQLQLQSSGSSSSATPLPSPNPPSFSSLYFAPQTEQRFNSITAGEDLASLSVLAGPAPPFEDTPSSSRAVAETKAALPRDTKDRPPGKGSDDGEPPPPYTEGSSPLDSFTYLMAAAGGAASIITQVQQTGGPPINSLGGAFCESSSMIHRKLANIQNIDFDAVDVGSDENITLDLRGTRFTLSRDELLTLPEFVLLSLFPNGLLPDGHMNSFQEGDIYSVDYDPQSLSYMLEFFRTVAQTIPSGPPSPSSEALAAPVEPPVAGSARDMLQDRAGIIVLREDLDFYAIPPRADVEQPEMIEIKRAAAKALLKQDGIFSGLRRSEETGTTEQHLIEMLTAGGFNHNDQWGHRAGEPNKAVICSLALARLRTDIKGNDLANSNAVGMAQKLLLFWRKPARRCWWEGVELEGVEGVPGKLKVWIRRVWTLEMSVIGLR